MDGIFIAYHNTKEMLGFEYKSLSELENHTHGNTQTGSSSFSLSIQLLDILLQRIITKYPKQDLEILSSRPGMNSVVFIVKTVNCIAEPLILKLSTHSEVNSVHQTNPVVETAEDDWQLYYDLKELDFDAELVNRIEYDYENLHGRKRKRFGFGKQLRQEINSMKDE